MSRTYVGATDGCALEPIARDRHDRALLQTLQCVQGCFDLSKLDAVTAALDLRVRTPHVIHKTIGVSANLGQVAGLIDSVRGVGAPRTLDKNAGSLLRFS